MANWANHWHALKNASTGKKALALGGAIGLLSSFWQKLSAENLEVLLAVGSLGADGQWIPLKQLRERLPQLTPYQLTRNISSLSSTSRGLLSLSAPKPAFLQARTSAQSNREKEVALTRTGMIAINRAIQTLSAGFELKSEDFDPSTSDSIPITPKPLLNLTLYGQKKETGERVSYEVRNLATLGNYGKAEATFDLAAQAISQGATVYWISAYPCLSVLHRLFSYADANMRSHAFYVSFDKSSNFTADATVKKYTDVSPNDVFANQGICFRDLDRHRYKGNRSNVLKLLESIQAAAELNRNVAGGYVVLEDLNVLAALISTPGRSVLEGFAKTGIKLHVLDHFNQGFMRPDVELALIELGFDIAVFGEDVFYKTGLRDKPTEGVAAYRSCSSPANLDIVQLDYIPPPPSSTQVIAANFTTRDIPVPA